MWECAFSDVYYAGPVDDLTCRNISPSSSSLSLSPSPPTPPPPLPSSSSYSAQALPSSPTFHHHASPIHRHPLLPLFSLMKSKNSNCASVTQKRAWDNVPSGHRFILLLPPTRPPSQQSASWAFVLCTWLLADLSFIFIHLVCVLCSYSVVAGAT